MVQAGRRDAAGDGQRRRPAQPLSRARVLEAALDLADAEGLKAVTMRMLAAELGVEAMSIYHHLPGKEGLLDGLVESLIAQIERELAEQQKAGASPAPGATETGTVVPDWRDAVRRRCLTARDVMVRHPWGPALITSRPSIPPAAYLYYESLLAAMVGGGLSYHLAHRALHALGSLSLGFAQEVFSPGADDAGPGEGGDGGDGGDGEFARLAEELPHLTAMVASEIHQNDGDVLGWCDSRAEFEFTLDLLLDGLARAAHAERRP